MPKDIKRRRGSPLRSSMIELDAIAVDSAPGYSRPKAVAVVPEGSGYRCVAGRALLAAWRHERARLVPAFVLPLSPEHAPVIETADLAQRILPAVMRAIRVLSASKIAAATCAQIFGLTTADALRCRTLIDRYPALLDHSVSPWISIGHVRLLVGLKPDIGAKFLLMALGTKLTTRALEASIKNGGVQDAVTCVHLEKAQENLHQCLATNVAIHQRGSGYRVDIDWTNVDVLTGVLLRLGRAPTAGHHNKRQIKRTMAFSLQDLDEFQALFGHLLPEE